MEALRIVFMGTPEFAVGILDAIVRANYTVVGVITATDKPAGRGQQIKCSAVKEFALQHNLKLLQPANLKDEGFLSELKSLKANLQIVVAFRMLPKVVWEMPELGTFNLHASLLPEYRGAAPINWAIINGEAKTGVTTFFIDDKIDKGAMILSEEITIGDTENAGQLHDRLMNLGSNAVVETLQRISDGKVETVVQQDSGEIKKAFKLNKENCKINWELEGEAIYNLVRGLSPYPGAWTCIKDNVQEWNVKIYEAQMVIVEHDETVGHLSATKKELKIAVRNGYLNILSVQFPGKKKMNAHELLNGMTFSANAYAY